MPSFEVDTYKVSAYLSRGGASGTGYTNRSRVLEMKGPIQYHGIQNRAVFAFEASWDSWVGGRAGYLSWAPNYAGLVVAGWFGVSDFEYFYDILRSERPVHVRYEYATGHSGSGAGYLRQVGLGTSEEQIGEGPSDSTGDLFAQLQAMSIIPYPSPDLMKADHHGEINESDAMPKCGGG